jgi:hypothetical protein
MRRDLWAITQAMTDAELDSEIAQLRATRALIAEDRAYERQMNNATRGLWAPHALAASEPTRTKLERDYVCAGLSDQRIHELMASIPVAKPRR